MEPVLLSPINTSMCTEIRGTSLAHHSYVHSCWLIFLCGIHTLTLIRSNWLPWTVPLFQSDIIDGNVSLIACAPDTFEDDLQSEHGAEPRVKLWRTYFPPMQGAHQLLPGSLLMTSPCFSSTHRIWSAEPHRVENQPLCTVRSVISEHVEFCFIKYFALAKPTLNSTRKSN